MRIRLLYVGNTALLKEHLAERVVKITTCVIDIATDPPLAINDTEWKEGIAKVSFSSLNFSITFGQWTKNPRPVSKAKRKQEANGGILLKH